jgi:hypothetical protein
LKAKINTSRTRKEKDNANKEQQSKNKEVKMMIRNDKRKFTKHLAENTQEAENTGNIKELYENTKLLSQKKWVKTKPVKDKQGVLISTDGKQLQRWKETLQDHSGQIQPDVNQDITPTKAIPTKPPTKAEITTAIQELNKGKAPGIHYVTPEVLKIDPELTAKMFEPMALCST